MCMCVINGSEVSADSTNIASFLCRTDLSTIEWPQIELQIFN